MNFVMFVYLLFVLFCSPPAHSLDCPVGYIVIETCQKFTSTSSPTNTLSNTNSKTPPSTSSNSQTNDWFTIVNSYRSKHQSPPLSISKELVADATSSVQQCSYKTLDNTVFGKTAFLEYTKSNYVNNDALFSKAVSSWYNTISSYDFTNPQFDTESGHATQLLWKSTTQIGCAAQLCKEQTRLLAMEQLFYLVVCSFYPPGNVRGLFEQNVLPSS